MKRWIAAVGVLLALGVCVRGAEAQENTLLSVTKSVVDYLDPTPEIGVFVRFKDVGDKDFSQAESFAGISGALHKFTSQDIELGSIRLGGVFEGDRKLYTALGINGIGIAKRYLPEDVKATLSPGVVGTVWDVLDKYGHVSVGIGLDGVQDAFSDGYTLSDNLGVIGTAGVRITW